MGIRFRGRSVSHRWLRPGAGSGPRAGGHPRWLRARHRRSNGRPQDRREKRNLRAWLVSRRNARERHRVAKEQPSSARARSGQISIWALTEPLRCGSTATSKRTIRLFLRLLPLSRSATLKPSRTCRLCRHKVWAVSRCGRQMASANLLLLASMTMKKSAPATTSFSALGRLRLTDPRRTSAHPWIFRRRSIRLPRAGFFRSARASITGAISTHPWCASQSQPVFRRSPTSRIAPKMPSALEPRCGIK